MTLFNGDTSIKVVTIDVMLPDGQQTMPGSRQTEQIFDSDDPPAGARDADDRDGPPDGVIVAGVTKVVLFEVRCQTYDAATMSNANIRSISFSENKIVCMYHVRGAGVRAVNGDYVLDSAVEDGVISYVKTGMWKGTECEFTLHSSIEPMGEPSWWISIRNQGGVDHKDFYYAPALHNSNWMVSKYGKSPAPQVTASNRFTYAVPAVSGIVKRLLFSEKTSDCKFVCQDNETIPAHKCFLMESSEYFEVGFSERWGDGEKIVAIYSAPTIKTFLEFLYTEDFTRVLESINDPLELLSLSFEYQIESLKELAELACIRSLNVRVFKDVWQAARLYDCVTLKSACIDYDAVASLFDEEDRPSSSELAEALSQL